MKTRKNDTIERTSIVAYGLLKEFHTALADQNNEYDTLLGILMGVTMFLDEEIGPIRTKTLMERTPAIVLKTDAHVTQEQIVNFMPVLNAMGRHLSELRYIPA